MFDALAKDWEGWVNGGHLVRACFLVFAAVVLGGIMGFERSWRGKEAGVRTHMLVTMGAALFALISDAAGGGARSLSRVIQGVAAGVGFLGAGAILKRSDRNRVRGLTTAASIWVATGVGVAAGTGHLEIAVPSTVIAVVILAVAQRLEPHGADDDG